MLNSLEIPSSERSFIQSQVGRRQFLKSGLALGTVVAGTVLGVPVAEGSKLSPSSRLVSFVVPQEIELYTGLPEKDFSYFRNGQEGLPAALRKASLLHQDIYGVDIWPDIEEGILSGWNKPPFNTDPADGECNSGTILRLAGPNYDKGSTVRGIAFSLNELDANFTQAYYGVGRAGDKLFGGNVAPELYAYPMALHHLAIQYMANDEVRQQLGLDKNHRYGLAVNMSPRPDEVWWHPWYRGSMRLYPYRGNLTRVELSMVVGDYTESDVSASGGSKPTRTYNVEYLVEQGNPRELGQWLSSVRPADFMRPGVDPYLLRMNANSGVLPRSEIIQNPGYAVIRGVDDQGKKVIGPLPKTFIATCFTAAGL